MSNTFHSGELQVQDMLGVRDPASELEGMIMKIFPPIAGRFIANHEFVFATSIDHDGNIWSSVLHGPKGFASVSSETKMLVARSSDDIFFENISKNNAVAFLFINLKLRLRLRVNGRITSYNNDGIEVRINQVYFNCPKYIQSRTFDRSKKSASKETSITQRFDDEHIELIQSADTFFISSFAEEQGADCSHRGGLPGFAEVVDDKTIRWKDYPGNNLYNTFGNLVLNSGCGLLFIDFINNRTLQMTGEAMLSIESDEMRLVTFTLTSMVETKNALPFVWSFIQSSPYNSLQK